MHGVVCTQVRRMCIVPCLVSWHSLSLSCVTCTEGPPGKWHPGVSYGLVVVCPCAHGFVR